ncbi:MAG: hypothetical protein HY666_01705 [Chloroflexi bacterium]|nr:hypothetical protein [Chloroflexota bacterium]
MGKRDYRNREEKKPKKNQKKALLPSSTIISSAEVQVIKKGKSAKTEDEVE